MIKVDTTAIEKRLTLLEDKTRRLEGSLGAFHYPGFRFDKPGVVTSEIKSPDFSTTSYGWRLNQHIAELQHASIRGETYGTVALRHETSAQHGRLLVTDAALLGRNLGPHATNLFLNKNVDLFSWTVVETGTTDGTTASKLVDSGQNFATTVEANYTVWNTTDNTFALVTAVDDDTTLSLSADIMVSGEAYKVGHGPILEIRANNVVEYLAVSSEARDARDINGTRVKKYGVVRDLAAAHSTDPEWKAGTTVASTKEPGEGWLLIDADNTTAAPRFEVRYRNNRTWDGWSTRARLGNLTSVTSGLIGVTPTGFGVYAENAFIEGVIHVTEGRILNKLVVGNEVGPGLLFGEDVGGFMVNDRYGRTIFQCNVDSDIIVRMGFPPDDPGIYVDRTSGEVVIQTKSLNVSAAATEFLNDGFIDMLSSGDWDDADATGFRVSVSDGILGKESGTIGIDFDYATGTGKIGNPTVATLRGLGVEYDAATANTYAGPYWSHSSSDLANDLVGKMVVTTSGNEVTMLLGSYGGDTNFDTAITDIYASGDNATDESYIRVVGGPNTGDEVPGITLAPQAGFPVTVEQGSLMVNNGDIAASGLISGILQAAVWVSEDDPPDSDAYFGRLMPQIVDGAIYRMWIGKGTDKGWTYVDLTEN